MEEGKIIPISPVGPEDSYREGQTYEWNGKEYVLEKTWILPEDGRWWGRLVRREEDNEVSSQTIPLDALERRWKKVIKGGSGPKDSS